jgi:hypothetical protein
LGCVSELDQKLQNVWLNSLDLDNLLEISSFKNLRYGRWYREVEIWRIATRAF